MCHSNIRACLMVLVLVLLSRLAMADHYNVIDYGAVGDGQHLCTPNIQDAIDTCHQGGGGYVVFPAGKFLTGTLHLKDNVYLDLHPSAILLGSTNIEDYDPKFLIYANGKSNIGIIGDGTINGQGEFFWRGKERPYNRPGRTIKFFNCQQVHLRDFDLKNSAAWCIDVEECDRVFITGLTIENDREAPNTDGIDPVSSSNVFISDCYINTGDDCICPKSNNVNKPCENIVVTNCVLISDDSAIKCGTGSKGVIRDCSFSDIIIRNTQYGIGFYMKDGGQFENMQFSDISIETTRPDKDKPPQSTNSYAIFMDIERRGDHTPLGVIRNISFDDINIITTDGNCLFSGMPERPIKDITLSNIRIKILNRADLKHRRKPRGTRTLQDVAVNDRAHIQSYFTFAYIEGLNINNLDVQDVSPHTNHESYVLWGQSLENVRITGLQINQVHQNKDRPLFYVDTVRSLFINGCEPVSPHTAFLYLSGDKSENIVVMANDLSRVNEIVNYSDKANRNSVFLKNNHLK